MEASRLKETKVSSAAAGQGRSQEEPETPWDSSTHGAVPIPALLPVRSWCRDPDVSVPDVPWHSREVDHRGGGNTDPWGSLSQRGGVTRVAVMGLEQGEIQNKTFSPSLYRKAGGSHSPHLTLGH